MWTCKNKESQFSSTPGARRFVLIRRLKRPHRLRTVCRAIAVPGAVSTRSELTEAGFAWLKILACV